MPTPALAQPDALRTDFHQELRTTRRVLERVPDEHLSWKPHPKSMSLGGLTTHIVNLLQWQLWTLEEDAFDLAAAPPSIEPFESRDQLLATFDKQAAALHEKLEATDEGALAQTWSLRRGGAVLMEQPRASVLRGMGLRHIVHHRGQLSVYLRLLDVPVPSIYGPTADEPMAF
jgi:uncharacterized damage-inducible protein DinB